MRRDEIEAIIITAFVSKESCYDEEKGSNIFG